MSRFTLRCKGVLESHFSDFGLGGIRLYPPGHPAARQYTARRAILRWSRDERNRDILGVLVRTHKAVVDDWIPVERYLGGELSDRRQPTCRGPEFLLKAYARALRMSGIRCNLTLGPKAAAIRARLRVLHFGASFVVARELSIVQSEELANKRMQQARHG